MVKENNDSSLDNAIKSLNKKYGGSSLIQVKDSDDGRLSIESIPTGCFSLDRVFGCGGLPKGRIIELFGQESSGKSSLALYIAAQIQKTKGKVLWIDAEFAFSKEYAEKLGVDINSLIVSQPESGEEAFDVISNIAQTGEIDLIVVDSVAALLPQSELEGGIDQQGMAVQARLVGRGLRLLAGSLSRSKTTVIFINQLREKVGVFYGKKEITPGGKSLKFFSSVRLQVKKGAEIKDADGAIIGNTMIVQGVKNKVGLPWRTAEFDIYYAAGIDVVSDLFNESVRSGVIEKTGNTYSLGEVKLGVGEGASKKYLGQDEKLQKEIKKVLTNKK